MDLIYFLINSLQQFREILALKVSTILILM